MKRDFKRCWVLIRGHLIATVFLLTLKLSILSLLNETVTLVVSLLIYASAIYLSGWNEGFRDSKKITGSMPDIPRAIKVALMATVLPVILLVLRVAAYHISGGAMTPFLQATDVIYRLYYFYFIQFMSSGSLVSYIIPIIIQPIIYVVGYMLGLKRIEMLGGFMTKFVYKPKDDTNNNK